ncbi:MAG TPA: hypothetical protein PLP73_01175 [Candidatus Absconditabacterales bacterium]|nr:hypothetical protein [Candidatus Absconditabacterales bacterium]
MTKLKDLPLNPGGLAYPEEMYDRRDFKASAVIDLPKTDLPPHYSLGQYVARTNYQNGWGSCFDGNSKVLMGDYSYKEIKDIKIDDAVLTYNGVKPVTKIYELLGEDLVRIKVNKIRGNKSDIICTTDHKFFVLREGKEYDIEAQHLQQKDKLLTPIQNIYIKDLEYLNVEDYVSGEISCIGMFLYKLHGAIHNKISKKIKLTDEVIKLFGYYIAEGSVLYNSGNISGISLTFHEDEQEYIAQCESALKYICPDLNVSSSRKKNSKARTIKVSNALLGELFYNLFGHLAYNKTIPDFIYNLPLEKFLIFFRGLVEGDGYIIKGSNEIGISLTASRCINKISNKLWFHRIPHSVQIRNNSTITQERADTYGIFIYGKWACLILPDLLNEKKPIKSLQEEFVELDGITYVSRTILGIEMFQNKQKVYNIEVDGNHSYVVHGIKVHNCTANATSHGLQVMAVKDEFGPVEDENKITPDWRDLWAKMGHDLNNKNDRGDYVEKALKKALNDIAIEEGGFRKFKGYSYDYYNPTEECFNQMKLYLYNGYPLIWTMRGNRTTRNEMQKGEVKTLIPGTERTGGHAICLVGYCEQGFWFLNSWHKNNENATKSVFFISYENMKKLHGMINWRYFIPFYETKHNIELVKEENTAMEVIRYMKKLYSYTKYTKVKAGIIDISKILRGTYPKINKEIPL